jgi:hypothetical protein
MFFRTALISLVMVLTAATLSFSAIIDENNGFPYKGIVMGTKTFKGMDLNTDDFKTVKNTYFSWEFTVKGKKYKADLLSFGAIYMTREGQNPVVLSFDLDNFRFKNLWRLVEQ